MAHDHARKAGNRGDVWKHFTLVAVVDRLVATDGFRYVDTHSGAPFYKLGQTGEWKRGIGKVLDECGTLRSHGYIEVAANLVKNRSYPSAWQFVADRLSRRCPRVEVVLTDTAAAVAAKYKESPLPGIPANVAVCFNQEDGYRHVELVSKTDLVLIDPPFNPNAAADWRRTRVACLSLLERHIPFLAWYPVFAHTNPAKLVAGTGCSGWEVIWARIGPRPSQNLKGCGLLVSPILNGILRATQPELETLASCLGGTFNARSDAV